MSQHSASPCIYKYFKGHHLKLLTRNNFIKNKTLFYFVHRLNILPKIKNKFTARKKKLISNSIIKSRQM